VVVEDLTEMVAVVVYAVTVEVAVVVEDNTEDLRWWCRQLQKW
jgi:hypothetical protein